MFKKQMVRNGLLGLTLSASLALGFGFGGAAEARVPDLRVGDFEMRCGDIQDNFDDAQQLGSQALIRYWINRWYAEGCHDAYGPISVRLAPTATTVVTGVDSVSPGTQSPRLPTAGIVSSKLASN